MATSVLLWPGKPAAGHVASCAHRSPDVAIVGASFTAFTNAASGQPGWISSLETSLATLTAGHGLAASLLIYGLCVLAGLSVFARRLTRPGLILAALLGLLFWIAEGFGGLATGQATDPNTGPLLILLAACFWPLSLPDAT